MKNRVLIVFLVLVQYRFYAQTTLWGITRSCGVIGAGTIFKMDLDGNNHQVEKDFFAVAGYRPLYSKLIETPDGKLWGSTSNNIFQYDPVADSYTNKTTIGGYFTGDFRGTFTLANNGKLYSRTPLLYPSYSGVLFELDPVTNSNVIKISNLDSTGGRTQYNFGLTLGTDSSLYGFGRSSQQTGFVEGIYQYSPSNNTIIQKQILNNSTTGSCGNGSFLKASNGKMYGICNCGGYYNIGTLIEYDYLANTVVVKYTFDTYRPEGNLVEAVNGVLYGVTKQGGINNEGSIYKYNINTNTFTTVVSFNNLTNGKNPLVDLTLGVDGNLYGVTEYGGFNNDGILFQFNPTTNLLTKKVDFFGNLTGKKFSGGLMKASNGKIYGLSGFGGQRGNGTLISYDTNSDTFIKVLDFGMASDGALGYGDLIPQPNGDLIGILNQGGNDSGEGVMFKYNSISNVYTKIIDFKSDSNGHRPVFLKKISSDKLLGINQIGGLNGLGTIYEYDLSSNIFSKKFDFNSSDLPVTNLTKNINGKYYGTGQLNYGYISEYDTATNVCAIKINFVDTITGIFPNGSLTQVNGNMYGLNSQGGIDNTGTLYRYDPIIDSITVMVHFDSIANGYYPFGTLFLAANNILYGTTLKGGIYDKGILFKYNPLTNVIIKLIDFKGENLGGTPNGELFQASNGKIYGYTGSGGIYNEGTIFQYDTLTNSLTTVLSLSGPSNGNFYQTNKLTEVNVGIAIGIDKTFNESQIYLYPNPNNGEFFIKTNDKFDLKVYNIFGQEILNLKLSIGLNSINLKNFAKGVYVVKLNNSSIEHNYKIINE